ncbi:multiple C2 and transmembrane domain-containing protein 2 [Nematolebias whitei]|uniref:multiple C2 and transmembrane domain-containing protein 2 n=1 Tax=Nematolebias whitei TaxID=451745 RepID=UPI00189A2963|nr:multiple C2 and transmembrane domain-containing protein 2 [Nematolebias whitei]
MDSKKKNFLENLRFKTKLLHLKKPRKNKPLAKQGRHIANRRSVSVPDLTFVPGEAESPVSPFQSTACDAIYFRAPHGLSDTDSVASSSTSDGSFLANKLCEPFTEVTYRVPQINDSATQANRLSVPVGNIYEEINNAKNSSPGNKVTFVEEGLYVHMDTKNNKKAQRFSFPETGYEDDSKSERGSLFGDEPPADRRVSDTVSDFLIRANSLGNEKRPHIDKSTMLTEPKKTSAEKGPVQTISENFSAEMMSLLDNSFETSDALSASAIGTSMEEQASTPWMLEVDEEELEQESSSSLMRDFCMDEGLELEESLEENSAEACEGENSAEACEGDDLDENDVEPIDCSDVLSASSGLGAPIPNPLQRYLLIINLKEGRNLVIRDKRSGTSDPYVKFKLEGKQFYKSKTVHKNLNPRWNESFSHPLRDRDHIVEVRVYDKNLTSDDFMGSSTISLRNLELQKTQELELHLSDPKGKENDLGVILVDIRLVFRDATVKRAPRFRAKRNKQNLNSAPRVAETPKNQMKNQMWTGVLHITLVEGQDLPQYGQGDIYVRFRLGDQKYKSKNLCIQANPQWREQFDFSQFEDNQEPLQVEVFSKRGRKGEESWGMCEVDVSRLPLNERQLYTHVLDPGKGKLVFLVTQRPCWGVSITDADKPTLGIQEERDAVMEKFNLRNSHKCLQEVGILQVSVLKANDLPATDINGKSNPFCVIQLGNCKLQTHSVSRTVNPEWNKTFTLPIKDINEVVELTVLDENGDRAPNVLGKVAIPLLTVQNGQQVCLFLKKEDLSRTSKGTITLVLDVVYNKIRAGFRTFQPKETKLIEENLKFNKKVLARNIYRVRKISTAVLYTLQYIKSCFQWESTQRSLIAFLIFLVSVWHWELFMLPLFLLLLIGWNYIQLCTEKYSSNQDLVNMPMGDDEEDDEKESGKKGLMDKIHMVQEVVLVVQNVLEEIANIGERIKNIFNWSVPFMSCLACLVLFVAATMLYFIPLRYIVLAWGINKFTKKLRNPYTIDSNEILDFLERVPSDIQKVQYSTLRAATGQNQPRKKK